MHILFYDVAKVLKYFIISPIIKRIYLLYANIRAHDEILYLVLFTHGLPLGFLSRNYSAKMELKTLHTLERGIL